MDETFDPYRKWLGIRDPQRPPNHYRLLGLEYFEDDSDVIALAADRQMAYLRTFQAGPHSALSQRLLNEMAAARVCLLSAERKAAYDQRLYAELEAAAAAAAPVGLAVPVIEPPVIESPPPVVEAVRAQVPVAEPVGEPLVPDEAPVYPQPAMPAPAVAVAPPVIMQKQAAASFDEPSATDESLTWAPARTSRQRRRARRDDASGAMWVIAAALLGVLVLLLALGGTR